MFCYEIPQFEKKRLLRTEMLEQLRDYPRDYLEILYSDYSDGILCGCTPGWVQDKLTIKPGILRYKEKLYFLKEPFSMTCVAQDKVLYLKVQFHAPVSENGIMTGKTRIYLDEIPPASADEMELCQFRLQEGARLRDSYENFADCLTEFDTIHLIDVLWASPEKSKRSLNRQKDFLSASGSMKCMCLSIQKEKERRLPLWTARLRRK